MFFFSSIISLSIRCNNYYFFYPPTDRNKKAGIFRFLLFRPNFQWFIFSILFIIHNNPGNNHNINIYRILVFEVFREALQCFGNVFFNCRGRYLKFVCYFTILQPLKRLIRNISRERSGNCPMTMLICSCSSSYSSLCSASNAKSE